MTLSKYALGAAAMLLAASASPAGAVSLQIGDVDSFGFDASDPALLNENGDQVDLDNDGFIGVDEALPDLNQNGTVATGSGDDFDNRSAAELADPAARFTDVSLSTSFAAGPGTLADVGFTLTFDAPEAGDADFVDHFFNLLASDIGDGGGNTLLIDGQSFALTTFQGEGLIDGGVTLTSVLVPLSLMLDGELVIDFTGIDPFIAIDSMIFAPTQTAPKVPLPAGVWLMLSAVGLLGAMRRLRG